MNLDQLRDIESNIIALQGKNLYDSSTDKQLYELEIQLTRLISWLCDLPEPATTIKRKKL